ncbi:MAG: PDZ domain-containing protein [Acidobacteria bacterium]|nr:PDZ domain-containing protein [Acidobacteriota bacterium]
MRLSRAIGLTVMILALAAAAAAWAPAIAAQQDDKAVQQPQKLEKLEKMIVMVDGRTGAAQRQNWVAQTGNVYTLGGPRLGVSVRDVETADVSKMKLSGPAGVVIEEVTNDSAAAKAGLKAGDVIIQFDGEAVRSTRQFTRLVNESAAGRALKLSVTRDGKRTDLEATLTGGEGPLANITIDRDRIRSEVERGLAEARRGLAQADRDKAQAERNLAQVAPLMRQFRMERQPGGTTGTPGPGMPSEGVFTFEGPFGGALAARGRLGVTVQELTPELAAYFGVKDGVLVSTVRADSPAAKAGIKAGDVITTVNDKPVTDASVLVAQLRDKEGEVTVGLSRDKKTLSVKATLEKATGARSRVVVRGKPA